MTTAIMARPAATAADVAMMSGVRARGALSVRFSRRQSSRGLPETYPHTVSETGGYRMRFPKGGAAGVPEAVFINTGGGVAGGDRVQFAVSADAGSAAAVTTQAAERIYRTLGPATEITVRLDVASGARLAWLPQETILYDETRLKRRIDVGMADDATLVLVEMFVFGRTAMGERLTSSAIDDRWNIRRGGRLVLTEAVKCDGAVADMLDRPAVGAKARAAATIVCVTPDAERLVDAAREVVGSSAAGAISGWNGLLCARFLSEDATAVRAAVSRLGAWLWRAPLPRVWWT